MRVTSLNRAVLRRVAAAVALEVDDRLEVLGTVTRGSADHVEMIFGRRDSESAVIVVITVKRRSSESELRAQLLERFREQWHATAGGTGR